MKNKNLPLFRTAPALSGIIAALIAAIVSVHSAQAANVALAWNRNTETNLAGYRLHYGTTSGSYSASLPVSASVTNATVTNLLGGQTYYFAVTASNTAGLQSANSSEVSYTVPASNTAPLATGQSVTTAEDTARAITLAGSDPDGNPLTYTVVTSPSHGALSGTVPNVTFTPAANYTGSDSFTFRANDGLMNSATATVLITVTAMNDAPVAFAQSVTTSAGTAMPITLTGTDADGGSLTYTIVTPPLQGTLSGIAPNLIYTPAAAGSGSFTFRVNDGTASSAPATVAITVTAAELPAPWVTTVMGGTNVAGTASAANNTFIVEGAGAIGGTEDNCRFVHQPMSGNGEIVVRLAAGQISDSNARIGVMIRENLNSGARSEFVGLASDGSLRVQARTVTSGVARSYTYAGSGAPTWLRLVRTDTTFVAYQSGDGSNWIRIRSSKIVMAANVHVGLAVGSGTTDTLGRATFEQPTVMP